ncbi:replicase protein, partial [Wild cucumber mosaic virus]
AHGEPRTLCTTPTTTSPSCTLKYDLRDSPVLVSGDDSVVAGSPPEQPSWPSVRRLLHLRFKIERTPYPLFCGYYVSPFGACRNPLALFAKLMICVDDGSLPDKMLSYLTEFSVGHLLGDSVSSALPPSLLSYHSACHDFFCRHATPSQKLLLSNDPIPESKLLRLLLRVKWVSKAFFSLLPQKARDLLVSKSSLPSFMSDPKVSQLESSLHLSFN